MRGLPLCLSGVMIQKMNVAWLLSSYLPLISPRSLYAYSFFLFLSFKLPYSFYTSWHTYLVYYVFILLIYFVFDKSLDKLNLSLFFERLNFRSFIGETFYRRSFFVG